MPRLESIAGAQSKGNPTEYPHDQLSEHRGNWVAFSPDGSRLIASATTLAKLEAKLREAGENLEEVLLERIPDRDHIVAGTELS
jgi:hypothetical protein